MFLDRFKYIVFSLLLFSAGVGESAAAAERRRERASLLYLEGVERQSLGTLREAAQCYEAAIREVPEHAAAYYRLSGIARMIGESETALRYGRRAYEIDPGCDEYADNYARLLTVAGDYAGADSLFTRLLDEDRPDPEIAILLAVLRLELGRPAEALALIDTLEARSGIQPRAVDIKRQALVRTERYGEAFGYMTDVCGRYPGEASFRIQLAELAAALRSDSVALANYRAAIALDSTGWKPRMALAEYYRLKERWPEFPEALVPVFAHAGYPTASKVAYFDTHMRNWQELYRRYFAQMVQLSEALLRSDRGNPEAQEFYARHLMYSGQFERAQEFLSARIAEGEAPLKFYRDVIEIAQFRQQRDTIKRYAVLARERFPKNPELDITLIFIQLQERDTLGAMRRAREVVRYAESDSVAGTVYGIWGDMAHLTGDNRAAFRLYERALKRWPENASVLNNFAYYLSEEQRDLERALRMAERANELTPHNATYLDTHAWVLYRLGRYEEAQTVMRKALVLDRSNSSELLLHYGDILYALGQRFMAKTYWKRALEAGADGVKIEERLKFLNE